MDDLNDEPEKVANDIINKQVKIGFAEEATQRIIRILTAYHQLREELAELEKQKQTEADVICDGTFAWRMEGNQRVGRCCAYCYRKKKIMMELIDLKEQKEGLWQCPECDEFHHDESYERQTHTRVDRG